MLEICRHPLASRETGFKEKGMGIDIQI